jgi:CRISPR-associated protein Csm2
MAPVTTIQEVHRYVTNLPSMSKLDPAVYAEPGGLADAVVLSAGRDLKATQLRKIFHYIKNLQRQFQKSDVGFNRNKVALIMPSLAYAKGRRLIPDKFFDLLALCFGQAKCRTVEDFDSAANFLEAIMAYHKFHNPKD